MVKKFAIFVATTGGPIQIERLTEERAPQSMICISGSTTILPISTEYNDFVRRGSGVIERDLNLTDKVSFRADVSGMIDAGKSWQLGFFLAHAVTASTKAALVTNLNDADYVIWATGCVDYDLNILKVDHLSEKLRTSLALFEQLEKKKTPITIIFPGNQRENISNVRSFANTAEIHAADDLRSLLELLNLDVISEPTKTHKSDDNFGPNSGPKLQTLLVSIAIFISLFTVWFFTESSTPEFSKLKPPQILDEMREDVTIKPKAVKMEIKPIKTSLNLTNNIFS